jgi:phosphonate transport system substrate-binding protein
MRRKMLSFLPALALLASGLPAVNAAQQVERVSSRTLSLGMVSEVNQSLIVDRFSDFVKYLAARLTSTPDTKGQVVIAPTPFRLARLIDQNQIDFYMESPYPTYLINNVQGVARLMARRWKGGIAEYRSLIFTAKNGDINRLEDLQGKLLVFEDPESTSGHFLPRHFLTRKGFKFADKSRYNPDALPTDVGYIFVGSQDKVVEWVLDKKAAAGAFSNDDYARLDARRQSAITLLAETEQLPRHLLSVRKNFPPALANRLEKVLLAMHETAEGREILKRADDTTKFELLPEGDAGLRRRLAEIFQAPKRN